MKFFYDPILNKFRVKDSSDALSYTAENIANKVTAFSSPTDIQYPSAKLVSDQLALKYNFPVREAMLNANKTFSAGTTEMYQSVVLTAPRILTLPAVSSFSAGQEIIYIDEIGGITSVNTTTITAAGSDLINGLTTLVFNITNGMVKLIGNGVGKWTANKQIIYSEGTWNPTYTGFTTGQEPSTSTGTYTIVGRLCNVMVNPGTGTSNSTTMSLTLPFTALVRQNFVIEAMNNNILISTLAQTTAGSNVLTVYGTLAGGAFTASGNKLAYINLSYIIQ